jgi:hypothetical protein
MTNLHWVAVAVGALGVLAAYLSGAVPEYQALFQAIAAGAAALGPVFAVATPKAVA